MSVFDGGFGASWSRPGSRHLGDLLSALLDGELPRSAEEAARTHLAACASCRAEMEDIRAAQTWVRGLPMAEPPFGFLERLTLQPPPDLGRRLPPRWVGVAAVAASAAAAFGLLGVAPPDQAPVSPSVDRLVEAHATGASLSSDPLSRLAPIGVPVTFSR